MKRYHLRRKDKAIEDVEAMKDILGSTKYVTLAMSLNDEPYLVSLNHGYNRDRGCIYFHCALRGKKNDYLRGNNKVWGQALVDNGYVQGECTHHYATVQFYGTTTFIEDFDEKQQAIELMIKQLENDPEPLIAGLTEERLNRTAIGRIDIEYMSGKRLP